MINAKTEEMDRVDGEIKQHQSEIDKIMNDKTPHFFWRDNDRKEEWTGRHDCRYTGDVPVCYVKEVKIGYFITKTVISDKPSDYHVVFEWGSAGSLLQKAANTIDVFGLWDHAVGEWNVEFYCLLQYHPDKVNDLKRLKKDMEMLKINKGRYGREIDRMRASSMEKKLELAIKAREELIEGMEQYKKFIEKVQGLVSKQFLDSNANPKTLRDRIEECEKVCSMWEPEGVDCSRFMRLYREYKKGDILRNAKDVKVEELLTKMGQFEEHLKEIFKSHESK